MRLASWLAFLSLAVLCRAMQANADPAELDDWCAQASQPSSIALCSDPELRELAIERNHAFEAARARLSANTYSALLREHKSWVLSYSTACGISETSPPLLPLITDAGMYEAGRTSQGRIPVELRGWKSQPCPRQARR
jgi:uncharacterized protein